mgnify:CR=1 FL=1
MNIFAEVKSRVSTLDAAVRYGLKPVRKGTRYWARCPFHNDKNPSLVVYEGGGFKCFGCGIGGQDSIRLTEKMFSLKPLEAAKKLVEDFNIPIEVNCKIDKKKLQEHQRIEKDLENIANYLNSNIETLYDKLVTLYRIFKETREEADRAGVDKQGIGYQWVLFHEGFFDRYSEHFALADTKKQIEYVLHIGNYYQAEVREWHKWINQAISSTC